MANIPLWNKNLFQKNVLMDIYEEVQKFQTDQQ